MACEPKEKKRNQRAARDQGNHHQPQGKPAEEPMANGRRGEQIRFVVEYQNASDRDEQGEQGGKRANESC
jgi:hypothetical protein